MCTTLLNMLIWEFISWCVLVLVSDNKFMKRLYQLCFIELFSNYLRFRISDKLGFWTTRDVLFRHDNVRNSPKPFGDIILRLSIFADEDSIFFRRNFSNLAFYAPTKKMIAFNHYFTSTDDTEAFYSAIILCNCARTNSLIYKYLLSGGNFKVI